LFEIFAAFKTPQCLAKFSACRWFIPGKQICRGFLSPSTHRIFHPVLNFVALATAHLSFW
ncbi:MAG: hypothetical protein ACK6EB_04715, partial [Planctomyces sp.]